MKSRTNATKGQHWAKVRFLVSRVLPMSIVLTLILGGGCVLAYRLVTNLSERHQPGIGPFELIGICAGVLLAAVPEIRQALTSAQAFLREGTARLRVTREIACMFVVSFASFLFIFALLDLLVLESSHASPPLLQITLEPQRVVLPATYPVVRFARGAKQLDGNEATNLHSVLRQLARCSRTPSGRSTPVKLRAMAFSSDLPPLGFDRNSDRSKRFNRDLANCRAKNLSDTMAALDLEGIEVGAPVEWGDWLEMAARRRKLAQSAVVEDGELGAYQRVGVLIVDDLGWCEARSRGDTPVPASDKRAENRTLPTTVSGLVLSTSGHPQ